LLLKVIDLFNFGMRLFDLFRHFDRLSASLRSTQVAQDKIAVLRLRSG
jgi:hypothetical protein